MLRLEINLRYNSHRRYAVEETKDLACAGGGSDNGLKTGYVLRQRNPSKLSQISADQLVCGTLEAAFMDMVNWLISAYKLAYFVYIFNTVYLGLSIECLIIIVSHNDQQPAH